MENQDSVTVKIYRPVITGLLLGFGFIAANVSISLFVSLVQMLLSRYA